MKFKNFKDLVNEVNIRLGKNFCNEFAYTRKNLLQSKRVISKDSLFGNIKDDWAINTGGGTEIQYHLYMRGLEIGYGFGFNTQYVPFKNEMSTIDYIKPFINSFLNQETEILNELGDYKYIGNRIDLLEPKDNNYTLIGKKILAKNIDDVFQVREDDVNELIFDLKRQFPIYKTIFKGRNKLIKMDTKIEQYAKILENKKQIILQGAPGTGKTYASAEIAMRLIDKDNKLGIDYNDRTALMNKYNEAVSSGQIIFTTFHQSLDYEEFVEGIRPETNDDGHISYEVKSGLFKKLCEKALSKKESNFEEAYSEFIKDLNEDERVSINTKGGKKFVVSVNSKGNLNLYTGKEENKNGVLTKDNIFHSTSGDYVFTGWNGYFLGVVEHLKLKYGYSETRKENKNYVLIIDEMNRGNVSKILGELITLLEADKRIGELNEIKLRLPYSGDEFGIPSNVYIIGTMNTSDRSVGYIDYAVRRRFAFVTLKANIEAIEGYYINKDEEVKTKAIELFNRINSRIDNNQVCDIIHKYISPEFDAEDLMIGHSYFMANNEDKLKLKLEYEIKPILREYVKDGILIDKGENKVIELINAL